MDGYTQLTVVFILVLVDVLWAAIVLCLHLIRREKKAADYWRQKWEKADTSADTLLRPAFSENTARYDHLRPAQDIRGAANRHLLLPAEIEAD